MDLDCACGLLLALCECIGHEHEKIISWDNKVSCHDVMSMRSNMNHFLSMSVIILAKAETK